MKKLVAIDGKIEYKLKKDTLRYEGSQWGNNDGKKAYSIEDTGNGIIFRDHFLKARMDLDYAQFEALSILMKSSAELDRIKFYKEDK